MAAAPRQPAAPRLKPRAIPEDAVIYREYVHQVMATGDYGAFSRTARVCSVSHVHVKNVVERHGPKKPAPPEPEEIAYEPAPGQEEVERTHQNEALLRQLLASEVVTPTIEITSIPRAVETETPAEVETIERDYLKIPYTINLKHGPDRTKANQRDEIYLFALVAVLLTVCDVLTAKACLGLSLMIMPEVLGFWWVVVQLRRLL